LKNSNRLSQLIYKSLRPKKGKDMGVSLLLVKRVPENGLVETFAGGHRAVLITLPQAFFIVKFFFLFIIYIILDALDSLAEINKGRNFYTESHLLVNDLFRLYPLSQVSI